LKESKVIEVKQWAYEDILSKGYVGQAHVKYSAIFRPIGQLQHHLIFLRS